MLQELEVYLTTEITPVLDKLDIDSTDLHISQSNFVNATYIGSISKEKLIHLDFPTRMGLYLKKEGIIDFFIGSDPYGTTSIGYEWQENRRSNSFIGTIERDTYNQIKGEI